MRTDLVQNQAASLEYILVGLATGLPKMGETFSTLTLRYRKSETAAWSLKTLISGNTHEIGVGHYVVDFTTAELDTVATFYTVLTGSGGEHYNREDPVKAPALSGVTLHFETAGDVPIPDLLVQVRDASGLLQLLAGQTNASGDFVVGLQTGVTYEIWPYKALYSFAGAPFEILPLTINQTFEFVGAPHVPGSGAPPGSYNLQVNLVRQSGAPAAGVSVEVVLVYQRGSALARFFGIKSTPAVPTERPETGTTDAGGIVVFPLVPNTDHDPPGSKYRIKFTDGAGVEKVTYVTMPAADKFLRDVLL